MSKEKSAMSYFHSSFASFFIALPLAYWLGGLSAVVIVAILAVLETSLSLDNAVVNATVLNGWSHKWRQLFLVVGLPIAVFGMRLVFPILIVSLTTGLGMVDTFMLALKDPNAYAAHLTATHHEVAAFGGTFLFMVAFEYFFDGEKEAHWLPFIEPVLSKLGSYHHLVGPGIALTALLSWSGQLEGKEHIEFLQAGILGLIVFAAVKILGHALQGNDEAESTDTGKKVEKVVKAGIGGLVYLEVLDASFSFDGVIGAFAITNQLFIIMLGLGVGAMFVRSLTIYLVDKGTLAEYRYLEHGAFWAILVLAVIMFVGVKHEIPEVVTGFIGAALIGASFMSSLRANKHEAAQLNEAPATATAE